MDKDTIQAILEAIRAQTAQSENISEQVKALGKQVDQRFKNMDKYLELRFDQVDQRFDQLDTRLRRVENIVTDKEHYRLTWSGSLVTIAGSAFTAVSVLINQIFFRLFP